MKVKCIQNTCYFLKDEIFDAQIDDTGETFAELYIVEPDSCGVTIAQVMKRFYLKDNKFCWYFDYYFKTHFEIID